MFFLLKILCISIILYKFAPDKRYNIVSRLVATTIIFYDSEEDKGNFYCE